MVRSQRFLLFSPFPSNLSGKFRPPPKTLTFGTWKSAGSKEIPSLELPHSGPRTTETVGHRKLGHGFLRCLSRDEEVAMGSSSICPIASMYGIFTYIWLIFMVNVGNIYHIWILWYIDQFSLGLGVQQSVSLTLNHLRLSTKTRPTQNECVIPLFKKVWIPEYHITKKTKTTHVSPQIHKPKSKNPSKGFSGLRFTLGFCLAWCWYGSCLHCSYRVASLRGRLNVQGCRVGHTSENQGVAHRSRSPRFWWENVIVPRRAFFVTHWVSI